MLIEYFAIFIFGLLIGNFATTILYRLPRGITIYGFNQQFTQPPFCSLCHHKLKFYEYLPFLSWFSTLGKCNYCGNPINYYYTTLEIFSALLSINLFYLYGFSDIFILLLSFTINSLLLLFIYLEHKIIPKVLTTSMVFIGIIYRTLIDFSVIPCLVSLSIVALLSISLLQKEGFYNAEKRAFVHILLPASIWCIGNSLVLYGLIVLALYILRTSLFRRLSLYPYNIVALSLVILLYQSYWQNIHG